MTDAGALPLALSDLVADLCGAGLLAGAITAGQAFGGDLEAVGVPSALVLAATVAARRCPWSSAPDLAWSAPATVLGTSASTS